MRKAKIFAQINQKGGVGKTSATVNLSRIAASKGKKVLIIDLDHQANTSVVFGYNGNEPNVCKIFENKKIDVFHVVHKTKLPNHDTIKNLDIIPSSIKLSRVIENALTRTHRESILLTSLADCIQRYDYIFIDCPPNLNLGVINAIYASDVIIIPVSGKFSLDGVADLLDLTEELKQTEHFNFKIYRNAVDQRNKIINNYIDQQLEGIKENLCNTCISQSQAIEKANASSMSVLDFDPKSKSVLEYTDLLKEIA